MAEMFYALYGMLVAVLDVRAVQGLDLDRWAQGRVRHGGRWNGGDV